MMNIMRFSTCTAANQVLFWRVQSRMRNEPGQAHGQLVGHVARLVQVFQLQADAGRAFEAKHLGRVLLVDHGQRRVVFVVARIEGADHGELLEPRHHAGRRDLAARRHQRDLVARLHEHRARQLDAEHDAELARHQLVEGALGGNAVGVGHFGFELGVDAAHDRALHVFAARNQRLRVDEGCRADHLGVLARRGHDRVELLQRLAVAREDLDVRHHAEHAVAHLFLEAVHHTEHNDQRRHAQGDAKHRDTGDEGDEAVAPRRPACARVAPAELQFIRKSHRGGIVASRITRGLPGQ
jgi:hypothetical protein